MFILPLIITSSVISCYEITKNDSNNFTKEQDVNLSLKNELDDKLVSINKLINLSGNESIKSNIEKNFCSGLNDPKLYECLDDLKDDLEYFNSDCSSCKVHCCLTLKFYYCIKEIDTCDYFSINLLNNLFKNKHIFYSSTICNSFKYPSLRCFFYLHETAIAITLFTFIIFTFTVLLMITFYFKFWQGSKLINHINRQTTNGQTNNSIQSSNVVDLPPTPPPPYSQAKNQQQSFPPPPTYEEANVNQIQCTNELTNHQQQQQQEVYLNGKVKWKH